MAKATCQLSRGQQRGSPGRMACMCGLTGLLSRDNRRGLAAKVKNRPQLAQWCLKEVGQTGIAGIRPARGLHKPMKATVLSCFSPNGRGRPRKCHFPYADEPVRSSSMGRNRCPLVWSSSGYFAPWDGTYLAYSYLPALASPPRSFRTPPKQTQENKDQEWNRCWSACRRAFVST